MGTPYGREEIALVNDMLGVDATFLARLTRDSGESTQSDLGLSGSGSEIGMYGMNGMSLELCLLGKAAGEVAALLAGGATMEEVPSMVKFTTPEGNEMFSILLSPQPITADNLDIVVTAGWISVEDLCKDVEPGSVDVCP